VVTRLVKRVLELDDLPSSIASKLVELDGRLGVPGVTWRAGVPGVTWRAGVPGVGDPV
jgi:hypothetical protein